MLYLRLSKTLKANNLLGMKQERSRDIRGPRPVGNAVLREMQLHSTRSTLPESDTTAVGTMPHDKGPLTAADSYLIISYFIELIATSL